MAGYVQTAIALGSGNTEVDETAIASAERTAKTVSVPSELAGYPMTLRMRVKVAIPAAAKPQSN